MWKKTVSVNLFWFIKENSQAFIPFRKHRYQSKHFSITRTTNSSVRQPLRIVEFSPHKPPLSFARITLWCRMVSRKRRTFYLAEIVFISSYKDAVSRLNNIIPLFGLWEKGIGWESENLQYGKETDSLEVWTNEIQGMICLSSMYLKSHSDFYWCLQRISQKIQF